MSDITESFCGVIVRVEDNTAYFVLEIDGEEYSGEYPADYLSKFNIVEGSKFKLTTRYSETEDKLYLQFEKI